ncbi:MAG: alanine:cation symporter family protein [Flavobacteriales bacterium]|nr:alanine:cation symporter family protein [Flavobacteriales bacterium]MCB9447447.1 alanine:cation symporter family protein [Flavobacteriales bacterium]
MRLSAFFASLLVFFCITALPVHSYAQGDTAQTVQASKTFDQAIDEALTPASNAITSFIFSAVPIGGGKQVPFVLIWLILGAIGFTIYFGFINLRGFPLSLSIVRGVYDDPNDEGEVSHFQALTTALSGTVGLGNIAGVAIAISVGGPGATFWMIVAGLLGMSSKFVECTLGVIYRNVGKDGVVSGGPMYYLSKGLKQRGMATFGSILAVIFAICCIGGSFGGGNMFQVNQACQQFINITGGEDSFLAGGGRWVFGLIMAALVFIVIVGGIKGIAKVTDKIVPFMCGLYVLAALIVIFGDAARIPHAFSLIFSGAFVPEAIYGGIIGVLITGFQRAAFSNEAGIGSASIAHSAVKTNEPVTEGLVALLEPFIDTVVVCTMTALVIVITGFYNSGETDGITMTSKAFESVIPGARYVLAVAVVLFAFSTMISWSYYGLKAWTFLFGNTKIADLSYKMIFLLFVVFGAALNMGSVVGFSDAMIFAMCFPNVLGLIILAPEVRTKLNVFLAKIKSGEITRYK